MGAHRGPYGGPDSASRNLYPPGGRGTPNTGILSAHHQANTRSSNRRTSNARSRTAVRRTCVPEQPFLERSFVEHACVEQSFANPDLVGSVSRASALGSTSRASLHRSSSREPNLSLTSRVPNIATFALCFGHACYGVRGSHNAPHGQKRNGHDYTT